MNHRNLIRPQTNVAGDPPPPVHRPLQAELATDADDTGIVMVKLKSFSPNLQRGPVHGCKPQVRPHGVDAAEAPIYAKRGDRCWVQRDERGVWFMHTWEVADAAGS